PARLALEAGALPTDVVPARRGARTQFADHYGRRDPLRAAPSHRVLAALRGEADGVLRVRFRLPDEEIVTGLLARVVRRPSAPLADRLAEAVRDGWERLLRPSLESVLRAGLEAGADRDAVDSVGQDMRTLLHVPT